MHNIHKKRILKQSYQTTFIFPCLLESISRRSTSLSLTILWTFCNNPWSILNIPPKSNPIPVSIANVSRSLTPPSTDSSLGSRKGITGVFSRFCCKFAVLISAKIDIQSLLPFCFWNSPLKEACVAHPSFFQYFHALYDKLISPLDLLWPIFPLAYNRFL